MKTLRKVPNKGLQSVNDKGKVMVLCKECKQWKPLFKRGIRLCECCMNKWQELERIEQKKKESLTKEQAKFRAECLGYMFRILEEEQKLSNSLKVIQNYRELELKRGRK